MTALQQIKMIDRLEAQGEKPIDSEKFTGVSYIIKDGHLIIIAGEKGTLAVKLNNVFELIDELFDILKVFKD